MNIPLLPEDGPLSKCDSPECREAITKAIAVQLQPVNDKLDEIKIWRLKVFGNGSGTKGYLETQNEKQEEKMEELLGNIQAIQQDREITKAIKDTEDKIAHETKVESDNKIAKRDKWLIVLGTAICSQAFTWVFKLLADKYLK